MKKLLLSAIVSVFALFTAFGQSGDENPAIVKSLFKGLEPTMGVLDVEYKHTDLFGQSLPGFGVNMGVVLGKHWLTGLTFNGAVTSQLTMGEPSVDVVNPRYSYFYAGWNNELILLPNSVVNVSFPLSLGVAGVTFSDRYVQGSLNYSGRIDQDYFFAAEAGVRLSVNLFERMALSGGASYRAVQGVGSAGTDNDFTAPFFNLGLRFKFF